MFATEVNAWRIIGKIKYRKPSHSKFVLVKSLYRLMFLLITKKRNYKHRSGVQLKQIDRGNYSLVTTRIFLVLWVTIFFFFFLYWINRSGFCSYKFDSYYVEHKKKILFAFFFFFFFFLCFSCLLLLWCKL